MRTCRQSGNPGNNFRDVSSGLKCAPEFSDLSLLMQQAISQSELTEAWINRKIVSRLGNALPSIVLSYIFFFFLVLKQEMFQSLISMFFSVSVYPEMYFLFCIIDSLDLKCQEIFFFFFANVSFIHKTRIYYFFLFVRF